jgi:hypothetical protein
MSGSRIRRLRTWVISAVVAGGMVGSALPASAGSRALRVEVRIAATGKIVDSGGAVVTRVAAVCTSGAETLEAFVTVSQPGVSSDMGFFPLACDGAPHRYTARVPAFDSTFTPGPAFASAYALVFDPGSGQTDVGEHSRTITLSE